MNLKKTIALWDQMMTSITFAEANEHDTARRYLEQKKPSYGLRHDARPGHTIKPRPNKES